MRRALLIGLAALGLAACPDTSTTRGDAGRPPECETRADCAAGKVCTAEKYCANCTTSGQCTVKETCDADSRLCVLRQGWGTQCAVNEDCQAGSWCKQGLCKPRGEVSLCPGGENSECPQGERCNKVTTVCEEDLGCSTSADCSAHETCNTGSRVCAPKCTKDTQSEVCAPGERCVGELCVQCTDNSECGVGLVCDAAGRCSAGNRCYTDRDCDVPLVCFVQTGACLPKAPPCISDDTCAANQRCDVPSGRCIPRSCQPDRYEPNDDDTMAFLVAPGAYRALTLCANDVDWFAITLARGDQLGVNLDADPFSENSFTTVIKDGTGRTLAGGKLLVSYVAPAAARYFVVIASTDPFQSYDVTFLKSRGTPCDDDALEPNDSAAQPTPLNMSNQADGQVCPQDQDWFRVAVPAGKGVSASLVNYDAGRGLLRLCLFRADGVTTLGCSSEVLPVVSAPAAAVGGQYVLVRVVGDSERVANSYTLKVELP
jgi:hypothetical protein